MIKAGLTACFFILHCVINKHMNKDKPDFVKNKFAALVKTLQADATGKWGKMNAQQMVEHVTGFFKVSTGQLHFPLVTPAEYLPKAKAFLLSDKEFRENTKAPVLPEEPLPLQFATMNEAVAGLQKEINHFIDKFEKEPTLITQHPVFGDLNFEEWVLLHYKHVTHHAKQFGLL